MIIVKAFDKNDIVDLCPDLADSHFFNTRLEILSRIRQNLVDKIAEIDTKIGDLKRDGSGFTGYP